MPSAPDLEDLPFEITERDRRTLKMTDEEFVYHDWEDLKRIIAVHDLSALQRKPSDLIRYITWTRDVNAKYGNITNYICKERLKWDPNADPATRCKNAVPFTDPADYKILRNDWPYGLTPDITHLVVWIKNAIPVRSEIGDLTDESRALIEEFIRKTFIARLERVFPGDSEDRVTWFKNFVALQSVRSLEHIHVLVRGVPDEIIVEWTGETRPKQNV